jgi:hypothetical protein
MSAGEHHSSKNVAAEVLILDDGCELFADVDGVHFDVFLLEVRAVEGDVFEQLFEDGMEAAGADVLGRFIDLGASSVKTSLMPSVSSNA